MESPKAIASRSATRLEYKVSDLSLAEAEVEVDRTAFGN
jgi:hypothetical protein